MNTPQSFILSKYHQYLRKKRKLVEAHKLRVLVFVKYIQSRSQSSTEDSGVLFIQVGWSAKWNLNCEPRTGDDCQAAPQIGKSYLGDVNLIYEQSSTCSFDKSEERQGQCTLAGTGSSQDTNLPQGSTLSSSRHRCAAHLFAGIYFEV